MGEDERGNLGDDFRRVGKWSPVTHILCLVVDEQGSRSIARYLESGSIFCLIELLDELLGDGNSTSYWMEYWEYELDGVGLFISRLGDAHSVEPCLEVLDSWIS